MDYESIFIENLKGIMAERGLHQKDIAEIAGVDPSRVSKVLKHETFFTFDQAMRIANNYGMSFNAIGLNEFNNLAKVLSALLFMFENDLIKREDGVIKIKHLSLMKALTQYYALLALPMSHQPKDDLIEKWRSATMDELKKQSINYKFQETFSDDEVPYE